MARNINGSALGTDNITVTGNPLVGLTTYTICGWAWLSGAPSVNSVLFGTGRTDTNGTFVYVDTTTPTHVSLIISTVSTTVGTIALTNQTWFHYAYTVNNGTPVCKTYINAALDITKAQATVAPTADFCIGINQTPPGSPSGPWWGYLADVAAWNVVLTVAEITALANGARPGTIRQGSLVGWWPLDGLQSPEPDLSGKANNGTVSGTLLAPGPPIMMFTPRWPQFLTPPAVVGGLFLPTEPLTGMRVGGPFFGNPIG